jgi:hypothetical protein
MAWKKWVLRGVGAAVLVLVSWTVWLVCEREWLRSEGNRELAAAVAETERVDPKWRWDDLNAARPKPPTGKNGADLIPRIMALTPKDWPKRLHSPDWPPVRETPPANVRFPPEVIVEAREELARARPAVELARTLKDFPSGYRVIQLGPNPSNPPREDTLATRDVANLLRWDVVVTVEDGNPGLAADDLLAMLYASRSIGDEPTMISQLARLGIRSVAGSSLGWVLAQATLTDGQLADLQAAWAADADEPLLLYGLRGERVVVDEVLRRMADGTLSYTQGLTGADRPSPEHENSYRWFGWWLYRGRLPRERAFMLHWFKQATEAARLPIHEQPAAMKAVPLYSEYANRSLLDLDIVLTPPSAEEGLIISRSLLRGVAKFPAVTWGSTAEARCAVVGLACERFRLKHGRWPETLAELPADLLPGGVPLDPFDGKPLRYRKLEDGVVLYSVGPDGKDDGGDLTRVGMLAARRGDLGFRLWNPEHRRQPPRPVPPAPDNPEDKP